jgi:hypothetical protein
MKRDNGKRIKTRKKTAGPLSDEQQKITVTKNGPYSVTGEIPLSNQVITNSAWMKIRFFTSSFWVIEQPESKIFITFFEDLGNLVAVILRAHA